MKINIIKLTANASYGKPLTVVELDDLITEADEYIEFIHPELSFHCDDVELTKCGTSLILSFVSDDSVHVFKISGVL